MVVIDGNSLKGAKVVRAFLAICCAVIRTGCDLAPLNDQTIMPNYSDYIHVDSLKAVKPEAVKMNR